MSHLRMPSVLQVPLDGVISYGRALVSSEHITGESLPVLRRPGDEIAAGSLNRDGLLVVKASRLAEESTPARIAKLTLDAQVGTQRSTGACMLGVLCKLKACMRLSCFRGQAHFQQWPCCSCAARCAPPLLPLMPLIRLLSCRPPAPSCARGWMSLGTSTPRWG